MGWVGQGPSGTATQDDGTGRAGPSSAATQDDGMGRARPSGAASIPGAWSAWAHRELLMRESIREKRD